MTVGYSAIADKNDDDNILLSTKNSNCFFDLDIPFIDDDLERDNKHEKLIQCNTNISQWNRDLRNDFFKVSLLLFY